MKALIALTMAAAAQQPQQFDLVCNGTLSLSASESPAPHSWHLRLDLARMKYCEGDCFVTKPIADAQANLITLEPDRDDRINTRYHRIDRVTGRFVDFNTIRGNWYDAEATCTPAPFSGFPAGQTKF